MGNQNEHKFLCSMKTRKYGRKSKAKEKSIEIAERGEEQQQLNYLYLSSAIRHSIYLILLWVESKEYEMG
jgi:hypothetical protein